MVFSESERGTFSIPQKFYDIRNNFLVLLIIGTLLKLLWLKLPKILETMPDSYKDKSCM